MSTSRKELKYDNEKGNEEGGKKEAEWKKRRKPKLEVREGK